MEKQIKTILSVQSGEKAMRLMQEQNKVSFIADKSSNKIEIKKELESLFDVKVEKVNVRNTMKGYKIAVVKLKAGYSAMDLATKLGMV